MIFWTFGLVALFGVVVVVFLLEPPKQRTNHQVARNGRTPAAVLEGPDQIADTNPIPQVSDFKVSCDNKISARFEHNVHQVRLLGEACKPNGSAELKSAQILNLSNGFVATVFLPDQKRFATDYISLAEGENRISLELQYSDGTANTRELLFTRQ